MTPHETPADDTAEITLMITVAEVLSKYLRYMPVSAAALPSLISDVARRMAPQTPPNPGQIPASRKKPRHRRQRLADKDHEPIAVVKLVVHDDPADAHKTSITDDTIDLAKIQITRLPARRARGL